MGKMKKVPVSSRALLQRINRKLAKSFEAIHKSRPFYDSGRPIYNQDTGQYYRIDYNHNFIVGAHIDLEQLGRELEVLAPWEILADE